MAEPISKPTLMPVAAPAAADSNQVFQAHYISGTHWDREWYRPVQEFRLLLVALIDELLDLMERSADFKYFHLDGQTCVLQDYLDIRPENRERLAALIRSGRILIGPWFTMPDLFCPGDEALIRNFLLGRKICGEWGVDPMPIGYTCDMFGHPSQMPQIYRGFGYKYCVLGRGTNEHTTPPFFTWESPDGSSVFTFKLQDSQGYGAFALPRGALESTTFISQGMTAMHAEIAACGDDVAKQREVRETWFRKELRHYVEHEMTRSNGSTLCLMDSMDHIMPAVEVPRYLRLIREACPRVEPAHSTLPAFFAEAERTATNVPTRRGELREPSRSRVGYLFLIPNCVSSRVRLKQANDQCQMLLERWVEPWLALANLHGAGLPERFLRVAWEHVLLNHAHDSICGCSIDQVHRDMAYRFDQARILADQLRHRAFGALTAIAADLARNDREFTLVIANPTPLARREVVTFDVDLPHNYPTAFKQGFFGQELKAFTLETADGTPVPYQRLGVKPFHHERSQYAQPCFMSDGAYMRYTVAAELDLPAIGFTALRVCASPVAVRRVGSLRTGPTAAANEHLGICIDPHGTLVLHDKATGETYSDLLLFEDRSEIGDGWFHSESINDAIVLGATGRADLAVVQDGPDMVSFRITRHLAVAARYDTAIDAPSATESVDLRIVSVVSLRRGARIVDVTTTVDNTAEDHRLRLLLPTDCTGATTWTAHHPFDFVERPIALDAATHDWQEIEIAEKPFLHAQAVGHGNRGLAFLSGGGLHEGGIVDDARRTLQITLLRSFRKTISTSGESDGLERGTLTYRYALMPFAGSLPRQRVLAELDRLQGGLLTRQTGARPSGYPAMTGDKADSAAATTGTRSYLAQATGDLQLSTLKPADDGDGLILRVWNPADVAATDRFTLWRAPSAAVPVNLAEQPDVDPVSGALAHGGAIRLDAEELILTAGPHRILTVRLRFQEA